jgi:hypothetical protein
VASQSGIEPPGAHYIDIDYYPEFAAGTFPRDLSVLTARYGSSVVNNNGTAPWTAKSYQTTLTNLMRSARTEQDWLDLLPTAGALAHYVEDMHNPMHMAMNYDGQLSGQNGLHSRYEGTMFYGRTVNFTADPSGCVYRSDLVDAILDEVEQNFHYNSDILAADLAVRGSPPKYKAAYYDNLWARCGGFSTELWQEASEDVASAWYSAWVDAGSPAITPEPATMGLLLGGAALAMIRRRRRK